MTAPTSASAEYEVRRWRGGSSAGRYGSLSLYDVIDGEVAGRIGHVAADVEQIVGRSFADGTRIRVTVEVLDEQPWPPQETPWRPPICRSWADYEAFVADRRSEPSLTVPEWYGRGGRAALR